jgi:hypothetical protein
MTITPVQRPLFLVASIPLAGYTLTAGANANVLTWNVPNDGQIHRFIAYGSKDVTVAETGGAITVSYTLPDGLATSGNNIVAGNRGVGGAQGNIGAQVRFGTSVVVAQGALTGGASVGWVDIWGS